MNREEILNNVKKYREKLYHFYDNDHKIAFLMDQGISYLESKEILEEIKRIESDEEFALYMRGE